MDKAVEHPFGAKDSESKGFEYTIPEGMEAVIEHGKVIVRRKESEDEKMRKSLIEYLKTKDHECDHWVAWLEKQKEQKPIEIIHIPKFRVGDIVQHVPLEKWDRTQKITYIDEHGYRFDHSHLGDPVSGGGFGFGFEDEYELVEQKPTGWNEKDEKMLEQIIRILRKEQYYDSRLVFADEIAWLKSRKDFVTQKEQNLVERATMQDFNYHDGEPDKKAWNRLIAILNYAGATSGDTPGEEIQALINWIEGKHKSIEKPSMLKILKEHLANTPREQLNAEFEALKDLTIDKAVEWSEKPIADIFEKAGLAKIVRERGNDELTNAVQAAMIELNKGNSKEWSKETLDEFTENVRHLIVDKLTVSCPSIGGGKLTSTVFIDDKTAKDIANGILFYVGKETIKNPNRDIPKWSEKDEKMIKDTLRSLECYQKMFKSERVIEDVKDEIFWLKSLRPQPKIEWNEEDEKLLNYAISMTDDAQVRKFLKSLRPQSQRRDTYYDIIHSILTMLKDRDFTQITPEHRVSLLNDIRVKCKNADECAKILDEPQWKPTEEQMRAFEESLMLMPATYIENKIILESLYEQLKKL